MSDAWKWAIAFSLGMAVLIAVGQPYMWPQVGARNQTFWRVWHNDHVKKRKRMAPGNSMQISWDVWYLLTDGFLHVFYDAIGYSLVICVVSDSRFQRFLGEIRCAGEPTTELRLCLFGRGICGFRLRLRLVGTAGVVGAPAASTLAGTSCQWNCHCRISYYTSIYIMRNYLMTL